MFSHYLKIALRNLLKYKSYTVINLIGLSIGLATGIFVLLYSIHELSYDQFHLKLDRLHRVVTSFRAESDTDDTGISTNAWPVGSVLEKEYPEVESVLYSQNASRLFVIHEGKRFTQQLLYFTPNFFDLFSFKLKKGNPSTALKDPFSIVITEEMETKFFAGQDAMNKTLILQDTLHFLVTGVLETLPPNSHIQFDMALSFATFQNLNPDFSFDDGWGNFNVVNYLLLKEGVDVESFRKKAHTMYMNKVGEQLKSFGMEAYVNFEPMGDIYLNTKRGNALGPVGSMNRVYLLSGISLFVLLLACINFINLSTARSVYRAKEVGIRKVVGSSRWPITLQFLSESFIITILSFIAGVVLLGLMLPYFNQLLAKRFTMESFLAIEVVSITIILLTLVTIISGLYPSLMLSSMKPVMVLKGKSTTSRSTIHLRKSLVVFQFMISSGLVILTMTVINQLKYMERKDLGFAKDQILVINTSRTNSPIQNMQESFKNSLQSFSMVESVSISNAVPGRDGWRGQIGGLENNDETISFEYIAVDDHYLKTFNISLVAGLNFDVNQQTQLADGLILNEAAVSALGFASATEALGKRINSPSKYPAGEIIGIVSDYHHRGLQQKIEPIAFDFNPSRGNYFSVRYSVEETQLLLKEIEKLWDKHFPGFEFNYFFLDQDFEKQYQSEQRLVQALTLFSGITILLGIIGLVGLVSFVIVSRTKEISIRKVLGANVSSLTQLLTQEFVVLVIVANVLIAPICWYLADRWLMGFAYRSSVQVSTFVGTFGLTVLLTIIVICIQTIRAALMNPAQTLKSE